MLEVGLGVLVVVVGAGLAPPVVHGPGEVGPAHGAGLAHQELLGLGERCGGDGGVETGELVGVARGDVTSGERRTGGRHGAQPMGKAHVGLSVTNRRVVAVSQPRRRVQIAGRGKGAAGVGRGDEPSLGGDKSGRRAANLVERVGQLDVAEGVGIEVERVVDSGSEKREHQFVG
jgi:hypothetical protein